MERENDSQMDKYLRKHLRRETPAEKSPGGKPPQPHSSPGKGRGGHLKHMKETPPPSYGKGPRDLLYCCPTDDKGGPCHAPDCDGRSTCMLQLQCKQRPKEGQELKDQNRFRCTITCGYCGKRRHYEDECHLQHRQSEKLKKAEEERRNNAGKGKPEGGGYNPWRFPRKCSPGGGRRSSAPPTNGRGAPYPIPKGEQPDENRTVPSSPSNAGAEKTENAKKRKLN